MDAYASGLDESMVADPSAEEEHSKASSTRRALNGRGDDGHGADAKMDADSAIFLDIRVLSLCIQHCSY